MKERKQKKTGLTHKVFHRTYVYLCTWQRLLEIIFFVLQEDKLHKQSMKDELVKQKKDKEMKEWESGKFALKCITAEID